MGVAEQDLDRLEAACRNLPSSSVQEEEALVSLSPILILMSTVLSLNRRWYTHALRARQHFERTVYPSLNPKTLEQFRALTDDLSAGRTDWSAAARAMWKMNEWDKARMLAELTDYLVKWKAQNTPGRSDLEALREWAESISKEAFVGRIKGLGPRAHEQLLWYIEGEQAIKLDRHLLGYWDEVVRRPAAEEEKIEAFRTVAKRIGLDPTALDARIWDYMQGRNRPSHSSASSGARRITSRFKTLCEMGP